MEEDEVEQALRHVVRDNPDIEQPLLQSTNADRQAPCLMCELSAVSTLLLPDLKAGALTLNMSLQLQLRAQ